MPFLDVKGAFLGSRDFLEDVPGVTFLDLKGAFLGVQVVSPPWEYLVTCKGDRFSSPLPVTMRRHLELILSEVSV